MALGANTLREMLHTMQTIRRFEERASEDYHAGKIYGVVHCYIGEEAIATGVCVPCVTGPDHLHPSRPRHCIAKGADLDRMMRSSTAAATATARARAARCTSPTSIKGCSRQRDRRGRHLDRHRAALAAKMDGKGGVAVSFFGDGASAAGPFHECMNIAAAWKLPILYVCENNSYAAQTSAASTIANGGEIVTRAAGYGIPGIQVDGNDIFAIHDAAEKAVARARAGEGPTLIECRTYRWRAHTERIGQADYRPPEEIAAWKEAGKDPIARLVSHLEAKHGFTDAEWQEMDRQVLDRVEQSCRFAEKSPFPAPEEALDDVFAA